MTSGNWQEQCSQQKSTDRIHVQPLGSRSTRDEPRVATVYDSYSTRQLCGRLREVLPAKRLGKPIFVAGPRHTGLSCTDWNPVHPFYSFPHGSQTEMSGQFSQAHNL